MAQSKSHELFPLLILALTFIVTSQYYSQLPGQIALHFSASGATDGLVDKLYGILAVPIASVILYAAIYSLPFLDTREKHVNGIGNYVYSMKVLLLLALLMLQLYLVSYNSLSPFLPDKFTALIDLVACLAILNLSLVLFHVKQNYFIGIRTPYTLSNKKIWERTNTLGGKLLAALAFILAASAVLSEAFFLHFLVIGIAIIAAFTFVYSLALYKRYAVGF